jgi:hypothetical protein
MLRVEERRLPEICRFFGIIITMYYEDHLPPHFHVRYGSQKALIVIDSLTILRGQLAPRVFGMVMEWTFLHQEELRVNWQLAREHAPLEKIEPLE